MKTDEFILLTAHATKINMPTKFHLFLFFFSFAISCLHAQSNEISLTELKVLYHDYYLASAVDSIDWTNKGNCDPGAIPEDIYVKAEKRINFFRLVNRLPVIKINADKQKEAQAAAFLMMKNNYLTHQPSKNAKCYSKAAADGAAHSCLAITDYHYYGSTAFLTGFVEDSGKENYFVGHRRWILYSKAKAFSYGATKTSEALYCNEFRSDTIKNEFMAYPWNGYVPYNLIFSKWCFIIPESHQVDFSQMKIVISDKAGKPLPFELYPSKEGFPDKTISWKMTSLFTQEEEEQGQNKLIEKGFIGNEIMVQIFNVIVDKQSKSYRYKIKIAQL